MKFLGNYLYIPRFWHDIEETHVDKLSKIVEEHNCKWIRFDLHQEPKINNLARFSLMRAPHDMQPKKHCIIDISNTEEEILANMKQKTRYNIKLAKKKGVEIEIYKFSDKNFLSMLDEFYDTVNNTASRKKVVFHKKDHYLNMFRAIPEENISLYIAKYKGECVAGSIMLFYNNTGTYLHGGTKYKFRNLRAPFLLQYRALLDAKDNNCSCYDFGGVYPDSNDPGKSGITRFKFGFAKNTKVSEFGGSWDLIYSKSTYMMYRNLLKLKSRLSK